MVTNSTAALLRGVVRHARSDIARQFVDSRDLEDYCVEQSHDDDSAYSTAMGILDGALHWESTLALADVLDQASAATEPQVWALCDEWWSTVDNAELATAELTDIMQGGDGGDGYNRFASLAVADALEVACPLLLMPQMPPWLSEDGVVVPLPVFPLPQRHRDALEEAIAAVVASVRWTQLSATSTPRRWLTAAWNRSMAGAPPSTSPTGGVVLPGPWEHGAA